MEPGAAMIRPPTPSDFDSSRASERAADPAGWRFADAKREALYEVIHARRDIRRFRPDPVAPEILTRVLEAAHHAPSVGFMQPWRFIVIEDLQTRSAVRQMAQRERLRQAERFGDRSSHFLEQKIEGIVEAPLGICVCCDHGDPADEVLGRATIPDTDLYSTACAIENLWLAARAEGLGVGWVSFYRPPELRKLLAIPERVEPLAYLCIGWPDERPPRPGLESAGWARRLDLASVCMAERWQERSLSSSPPALAPPTGGDQETRESTSKATKARAPAASAVRDRLDCLVKPAGSLGALEGLLERFALITGGPPPVRLTAGVLICAGDHGHTRHGTSLFESEVSGQVCAAAARGETAVGVLSNEGNHRLLIADLGLACATPPGLRDCKLGFGTEDFTSAEAIGGERAERALEIGAQLCSELAAHSVHCLVAGEIGIGNTTTAAALLCALTGVLPEQAVGRGTGLDHAGIVRKQAVVRAAIERHGSPLAPLAALSAVGGFELAALTGAYLEAARRSLPVVLDGFATGVAALAAVAIEPAVGEILIAGHRSSEPAHALLLRELGLEPLLDLRLRLGEASGALLALPLIDAAALLLEKMGTFQESGVRRPRANGHTQP
jgi:nicotinate-nucleotide--dimethylbenzimidazole phosphoribosyltransferase